MPLANDSDTKPDLHVEEGTVSIVPGCSLWPASTLWPIHGDPEDRGSREENNPSNEVDGDHGDEHPPQVLLRGLPVAVNDDTKLVSGAEPTETVQGDHWSCSATADDGSERSERSEHSRPSTSFSMRNRAAGDPNSEDWGEEYHDAGPQGAEDGVARRAAIENTVVISAAYGGEASEEAVDAAVAQMAEDRHSAPAWLQGAVRPERRIVEVRLLPSFL